MTRQGSLICPQGTERSGFWRISTTFTHHLITILDSAVSAQRHSTWCDRSKLFEQCHFVCQFCSLLFQLLQCALFYKLMIWQQTHRLVIFLSFPKCKWRNQQSVKKPEKLRMAQGQWPEIHSWLFMVEKAVFQIPIIPASSQRTHSQSYIMIREALVLYLLIFRLSADEQSNINFLLPILLSCDLYAGANKPNISLLFVCLGNLLCKCNLTG